MTAVALFDLLVQAQPPETPPQADVPDALLLAILAIPGVLTAYAYRALSRDDDAISDTADFLIPAVLVGLVVYASIVLARLISTRNLVLDPSEVVSSTGYVPVYVASLLLSVVGGAAVGWAVRKREEWRTGATIHRTDVLPSIPEVFEKPLRVAVTLPGDRTIRGLWKSEDEHGVLLEDPIDVHAGSGAAGGQAARPGHGTGTNTGAGSGQGTGAAPASRTALGDAVYVRFDDVSVLSVLSDRMGEEPSNWPPTEYEQRLPVEIDDSVALEDGLSGVVANDRSRTLAYVLVTVDFLGEDGLLVARGTDEVTNLRPDQRWQFQVSPERVGIATPPAGTAVNADSDGASRTDADAAASLDADTEPAVVAPHIDSPDGSGDERPSRRSRVSTPIEAYELDVTYHTF